MLFFLWLRFTRAWLMQLFFFLLWSCCLKYLNLLWCSLENRPAIFWGCNKIRINYLDFLWLLGLSLNLQGELAAKIKLRHFRLRAHISYLNILLDGLLDTSHLPHFSSPILPDIPRIYFDKLTLLLPPALAHSQRPILINFLFDIRSPFLNLRSTCRLRIRIRAWWIRIWTRELVFVTLG